MSRMRVWRPARLMFATALMVGVLACSALIAQEKSTSTESDKPVYPVLSINVASLDHLFGRMNLVFDLIGRPELSDLVGAKLADFRDLKGLDRTRPLGLMVYLNDSAFLQPVPVAYLPVKDMAELKQTGATVNMEVKDVAGEQDRYELVPQRGGPQQAVLKDGYLFITQDALNLEQSFADPVQAQADLSRRYDIAISINLKHVPEAARTLLSSTLRGTTQAAMQQRDNEPEAAYQFRRAQAEGNLRFMEGMIKDGDEATIGIKVDPADKTASIEMVIKAKPNSGFAKELGESAGKPSYFAAALDSTMPVSASMSQTMNKFQKKQMKDLMGVGEKEVNRQLAKLPKDAKPEEIPQLESIHGLFDSISKTIDNGHMDGFLEFFGNPKDKFVIIGGIRLINADAFGVGLQDVLTRARESAPDVEFDLAVASHGDAVFHRISGGKADKGQERMFGGRPSLYLGTDHNALWFAVGGENAMSVLKTAMDKVAAGQSGSPQAAQPVPFEFVLHLNHFLGLREDEFEKNPQAKRNADMAKEAFTNTGSDELRIDVKPIENGFRMRAVVQAGYLRLLGLAIARAADRATGL